MIEVRLDLLNKLKSRHLIYHFGIEDECHATSPALTGTYSFIAYQLADLVKMGTSTRWTCHHWKIVKQSIEFSKVAGYNRFTIL